MPGIEIVDLKRRRSACRASTSRAARRSRRELQLKELEAARKAGVDALVAVYHSDHRELCAHERDWPFRIVNILEIVGESMGLSQDDRYKISRSCRTWMPSSPMRPT